MSYRFGIAVTKGKEMNIGKLNSPSQLALIVSLMGMTLGVCAPANAQTAPQGTASAANEVVIVTARKRAEELQKVPVSIAAFSGPALEAQGITDTAKLVGHVPGVAIQDGGPGYRTIFIRGMGSDRGNAATTGLYLDESSLPPGGVAQAIVEPLYFDISRVEVLRGPQGTIFGGSSMGGTLRIISNRPDATRFSTSFGADVSTTSHSSDINHQFSVLLNLPLVEDRAAFRAVISNRHRAGFIDEIVAPAGFSGAGRAPIGNSTIYSDVNTDDSLTARAAFLFKLTDRLTVEPSIFYQKTEGGGFAAFDRPGDSRTSRRQVFVPESLSDETRLTNLIVRYDFDNVEFLSSTSRSVRPSKYTEDITDYLKEVYAPVVLGVLPVVTPTPFNGASDAESFTQEFRLSSKGDNRLNYVVGAYYEKTSADSSSYVAAPGFATALGQAFYDRVIGLGGDVATANANKTYYTNLANSLFPGGVFVNTAGTFERTQRAVFGEADFDLTQRLNASVGLRYYNYELSSGVIRPAVVNSATTKEDGISPRVTLSYQATPDFLIYGTASRGFRPGGANGIFTAADITRCGAQYAAAGVGINSTTGQVQPYKSDSVVNYELGAKTSFAGNRFRVNGSIYRMNWSDIQQLYFPTCGRASTQNFGKAEINGQEVEFQAKITPSFTVAGGFAHNDAQISQNIPQLGLVAGTKIQNSPEWTSNLNLQLAFQGPIGTRGTALFGIKHTDGSFRDFNQTAAFANRFQDGYTTSNARIALSRDKWTATLYVDNLTDESPGTFNFLSSGGIVPSRERMFTLQPRTFGINIRIDN